MGIEHSVKDDGAPVVVCSCCNGAGFIKTDEGRRMTKTDKELALEYAHKVQLFWDGQPIDHYIVVVKEMAFLAGYQAAKEQYAAAIETQADTPKTREIL